MAIQAAQFLSNGNWTAPSGVNKAWVVCLGGGGAGGGVPSAETGTGGGGAGGALAASIVTVVPGTSYAITVGGDRAGGTVQLDGNDSSFSNLVVAKGGQGGSPGSGGNAGSGGVGSTSGCVGDLLFAGGSGSAGGGLAGNSGASGGPGQLTQAGLDGAANGNFPSDNLSIWGAPSVGGRNTNGNGFAERPRGAGGGGAYSNITGTNRNGGSGRAGFVFILWDDSPSAGGVPLIGAGGLVY